MSRLNHITFALLLFISTAHARIWTNTEGQRVDAQIVEVHKNKTVKLRTRRGKTFTVPFSTFVQIDIDHLEQQLAQQGHGIDHPTSHARLNELLGLPLFNDECLWDDPTDEVAKRLELRKESQTDYMENYRAYPLGEQQILGQPVYTIALYGGTTHAESLSMVFINQGDPLPSGSTPSTRQIEACGTHLQDLLTTQLGKPKRDSLGRGDLREKVWRWDWNEQALLLSLQEGKYVALRIMPIERADRSGQVEKLTENELKQRMAGCVQRRDNGDVVIRNIPMVDQGPKGYCSPATWERYLRYMEIPADMYLLALAARTGIGGGTYSHEMRAATQALVSSNGRELETVRGPLSPEGIADYIDQGLPIMWSFLCTPKFQDAVNRNTARRNGKKYKPRKKKNPEEREPGGHICLIIGYNQQTDEIAISDSWGPRFAERWVPARKMHTGSYSERTVIKW